MCCRATKPACAATREAHAPKTQSDQKFFNLKNKYTKHRDYQGGLENKTPRDIHVETMNLQNHTFLKITFKYLYISNIF